MATIKQTCEHILKHPYYQFALREAIRGDMSAMERILMEHGLHIWEKCSLEASRVYGNWHKANHMDIKREIRLMEPPKTLDLRLPVPDKLTSTGGTGSRSVVSPSPGGSIPAGEARTVGVGSIPVGEHFVLEKMEEAIVIPLKVNRTYDEQIEM